MVAQATAYTTPKLTRSTDNLQQAMEIQTVVDAWVLWIPVIAAAVGGAIGAAASIGSTLAAAWVQGKRERDNARNAELDQAELALKEISKQMTRHVVAPGWWPSLNWLDPPRDFAYDVVRLVPDEKATAEWTAAAQDVMAANTSLWRLWLWHLFKFGTKERQRLAERIIAAEVAMVAAAEEMRPGRRRKPLGEQKQ